LFFLVVEEKPLPHGAEPGMIAAGSRLSTSEGRCGRYRLV
jgi:hypothetical protein